MSVIKLTSNEVLGITVFKFSENVFPHIQFNVFKDLSLEYLGKFYLHIYAWLNIHYK